MGFKVSTNQAFHLDQKLKLEFKVDLQTDYVASLIAIEGETCVISFRYYLMRSGASFSVAPSICMSSAKY